VGFQRDMFLDGTEDVAVSPERGSIYVTASVDDAIAVFERNEITDLLTWLEVVADGVGGVNRLDGVRHRHEIPR